MQEIDNDGQINFAELKDTMIETLSLVFAKGEDANERTKYFSTSHKDLSMGLCINCVKSINKKKICKYLKKF